MRESNAYQFCLKVGQQLLIVDPETLREFHARVIGADYYAALVASPDPNNPMWGLRNQWISYTLISEDAPAKWGKRFWAVDSQRASESDRPRIPEVYRSFYVASQKLFVPEGFEYESRMSGRVNLSVVGEALHLDHSGAAAQGVLETYIHPDTRSVWAQEVFEDRHGLSRMVFDSFFDIEFREYLPEKPRVDLL